LAIYAVPPCPRCLRDGFWTSVEPINTCSSSSSKGKERKGRVFIYRIYTAFSLKALRHGSQFYQKIAPCLPFFRKRSPDGASTKCGGEHLIAAHYSFIDPEKVKG